MKKVFRGDGNKYLIIACLPVLIGRKVARRRFQRRREKGYLRTKEKRLFTGLSRQEDYPAESQCTERGQCIQPGPG